MSSKTIVILGTSRDDSNTLEFVQKQKEFFDSEIIELHKLKILPYKYVTKQDDDFLSVVEKMIRAELIVFATPVYWYAMSGTLKTFFDRLSDLITIQKELGRKLAGKQVMLYATGSDPVLPEGFEVPFQRTAEYFDMKYNGFSYCQMDT